MKRLNVCLVVGLVLVISASRGLAGLNNSYGDSSKSFGFNTQDIPGEYLTAYLNTDVGQVDNVSADYSYTGGDDIWVDEYMDAIVGLPANGTVVGSQSMAIILGSGEISEWTSTGYYDANGGGDKGGPIGGLITTSVETPDYWSMGEAGVSLPDTGIVSVSASGYYDQFTGIFGGPTYMDWSVDWNLDYENPADASQAAAELGAVVNENNIPEPAGLGTIGFASALFLRRRHSR
jgi:hypothetical protein